MDIDLGPACNIASYRDLEWFEDIPAGDCVLAGIPFAIRDAIVLMHGYVEDKRSRFYPDLPECVVVEVGQKATALAFLHTARFQFNAFRWNNNEAIAGEYRIHFEDGGVERLPVTVGGNVRNHGDSSLATLPYEQPALVADGRVLLSACCWENPCPEREIERIEIVSVEDTATSIAPFAITELDAVPWDDKVFLSAADVQIGARTSRMLGWRQQAADQLAAILAEKGLGPEALDDWPVNRSILKLETDDEFFGAIDLERPELAEVREAAARGNTDRALKALADHLRSRWNWLRNVLNIESPEPDHDTIDADGLCVNRFSLSGWTYDYGDREIDFYAVPIDLKPEPHWYFTHYLQYVGPSLYDAYAATGDERHARRLFRYMDDIIVKCPIDDADGVGDNQYFLPASDADGDGWPDRPGQTQAWDVTTSANRLAYWMRGVAQCMDSASATDVFLVRFLRSALEQIRHTFSQASAMLDIRTNHATFIAGKLIECGVCFPEFRCAGEWRAMGLRMLQRFYAPFWRGGMIYPDGSTSESHTGGYGAGMVRELKEPLLLLKLGNEAVPDALYRTLETMYEWLLAITTPLGYASSISMVYHEHYGFDVEQLAREAHEQTGREDLLYIGTSGREGNEPTHTSYPHTSRMPCYGGVYAMRSRWEQEALYLCAKMGPMHYRHCANQGHFVVDAYGTELVIGPGYAHEGSEFHDYTDKYMCGDGMSYNTVSIDGVGQKEGRRGKYALRQLDNLWYTNEAFDYLEGNFDFGPQGIGVVHTRSILFVKPDYWLVIDRMESESDDQDHAFRMKIQLDKDLVTEQTGVRVLARNPSTGVGLHVQSFDGDASLEIVKGQKHPRIEGWLAVSENAWPAPAAIYTKQVRAPAGFQTLLFPERDGEAVSVDAAKSGSVLTAHIRREELELTDTFLISSCSTDAVRFEGRLAWARSVGRDVMCASLIDGDRLGLAKMGLDLVLERRGTICVTRTSDGEWEIFADLMNLPGIAGTLNGIGFRLEPGLKVRIGDAQLSPVTGAERSS